jgi:Sulfotransferase family
MRRSLFFHLSLVRSQFLVGTILLQFSFPSHFVGLLEFLREVQDSKDSINHPPPQSGIALMTTNNDGNVDNNDATAPLFRAKGNKDPGSLSSISLAEEGLKRGQRSSWTMTNMSASRPTYSKRGFIPIIKSSNAERSILYVHVGKTGGTSLDVALLSNCRWYHYSSSRKRCFDNFHKISNNSNITTRGGESVLSTLTNFTMHCRAWNDFHRGVHHTTSFLFTVRNPIHRAVSAFDMGRNANPSGAGGRRRKVRFYEECFPTAEDLVWSVAVMGGEATTTSR